MMLTGKARDDFFDWKERVSRISNESHIEHTLCSSLIIEWLDYVGITIEIGVYPDEIGNNLFSWSIFCNHSTESNEYFRTRMYCTKNAIQKAIEIYNKQ